MVALAILGIGLGVVLSGFGQALRLRAASADRVRLALVAESVLARLLAREDAPAVGDRGEENGCTWSLEAVGAPPAAASDASAAELVPVRLTVSAPSGQQWVMHTLLPEAEGTPP